MRVVGISGSVRRDSYNRMLLAAAREVLPPGSSFDVWDDLKRVPAYDEDDEAGPAPEAVAGLRASLAVADAVLVATPEYNASLPGALKNALDWISRPLEESPVRSKPVAVVGASTGAFGAVWAQAELRKVLARLGARVLNDELAVAFAAGRFDAAGRLADEGVRDELGALLERLLDEARARAAVAA